ncbi:hypothetical protein B0T10DRAFT_472779 [Thelonectria olida]|uniref:Uncharacterized protein n=1 Tax=Thelonectria olida TaxID=1576542 RepID=A0A9P8WI95_9HYPO|nr:hypothetical protein B0T10DRAFT_472779 [Thelonectria olida]
MILVTNRPLSLAQILVGCLSPPLPLAIPACVPAPRWQRQGFFSSVERQLVENSSQWPASNRIHSASLSVVFSFLSKMGRRR